MRRIILVFVLFAPPLAVDAATLHVPTQYPTIQDAVNAAANGDTVQVAAGTYQENITIEGKAVSLVAPDGPFRTTIDGGGVSRVITVVNTGRRQLAISGFTLTNGAATLDNLLIPGATLAGAIFTDEADVLIQGNYVTGNVGCGTTAIHLLASQVILSRNLIVRNPAAFGCGFEAVYIRVPRGRALVEENIIAEHQTAGIVLQGPGKVLVRRNIIRDNSGVPPWGAVNEAGGLFAFSITADLEDNVFSHNSGLVAGGAYVAPNFDSTSMTISGNRFTGNTVQLTGPGVSASGLQVVSITENDFRVVGNFFEVSGELAGIVCPGGPVAISRRNVFVPSATAAFVGGGCFWSP